MEDQEMRKNGRQMWSGNVLKGFKVLDEDRDRVQITLPDIAKYAHIEVFLQENGELEIRSSHGELIIKPRFSNSFIVDVIER